MCNANETPEAPEVLTTATPEQHLTRRAALLTSAGIGLIATASVRPSTTALAARGKKTKKKGKKPKLPAYQYAEAGWRYCDKCRTMFFSPKGKPAGACATGGKHQPSLPASYINYFYKGDQGSIFYQPFMRCKKCSGLYADNSTLGVCEKGGTHIGQGTMYQVYGGTEYKPMMDGAWDYCLKCRLVYNWAGGATGSCPGGGGHSRGFYSFSFALLY